MALGDFFERTTALCTMLRCLLFLVWYTSLSRANCPFHNIDIVLETYHKDVPILQHALTSLSRHMPCWRKMHIVAPKEDLAFVKSKLPELHELHLWPLVVPQVLLKVPTWSGYLAQAWHNMWADNYTRGATFLMFFDSDVIFSRPFACDALFDEKGRPYWYYFAWWRNKFREECEELIGPCPGNFMSVFPIVIRPEVLQLARDTIMSKWPAPTFDESFAKWGSRTKMPQRFSQFCVLGNIALRHPNLTAPRPCSHNEGPEDRPCMDLIPLAWHKWPYGLSTGSIGRVVKHLTELFAQATVPVPAACAKGVKAITKCVHTVVRSPKHYRAIAHQFNAFGQCVVQCGGRSRCSCPVPKTLLAYPNLWKKANTSGLPVEPCNGPCANGVCAGQA